MGLIDFKHALSVRGDDDDDDDDSNDRSNSFAAPLGALVSESNVLDVFELAVKHNGDALAQYCLWTMQMKWHDVYSKRAVR